MSMGMLYPINCMQADLAVVCIIFVYIHIGVGFGVARSDGKGNARALEWWNGHQASSHAFFVCALSFDDDLFTAL